MRARDAAGIVLAWLASAACSAPAADGLGAVAERLEPSLAVEVRGLGAEAAQREAAADVERQFAQPLSPAGAVRIALHGNRRVRAELERLGISRAHLWQAGLLDNPLLVAGVGFPVSDAEGSSVEVALVGDLLDMLLLPSRRALAQVEHARTAIEVAEALADFAAGVREAYFEALGAQQIAELRALVAEGAGAAAELARRMHEAGNVSDLELVRELDVLEEARAAAARAQAEHLAARERLARELGLWGPPSAWSLPERLPALPESDGSLEGLEARAVAQRLDLAAAVRTSELLAGELGLSRDWGFLGALDVGLRAEREGDGARRLGPELELELPLFDRGDARRAGLQAELARADHTVFALAVEVRSQVREARERLRAARALVEHARDVRLPTRAAAVRLTQAEFDFMLAGAFDLLAAKRAEHEAQEAYVELVRDYWIARSALERAVGGPLPPAGPAHDHHAHGGF